MWLVMERELEDDDAGKTFTDYLTFQYSSIEQAKEVLFSLVHDSLIVCGGNGFQARQARFLFMGRSFKSVSFVENLECCSDSEFNKKVKNLKYEDISAKIYSLEEWAEKMEIKAPEEEQEPPPMPAEDELYFCSRNPIGMSDASIRQVRSGKRTGYIVLGKRKYELGRGFLQDNEARNNRLKIIVTGVRHIYFEDLLYDDLRFEGVFSHDELADKFSTIYGDRFKRTSMMTVLHFMVPSEKPREVVDGLPF